MLARCGVSMPFIYISQMSHAVLLAFPVCSFLLNLCCIHPTILDTWSRLLLLKKNQFNFENSIFLP
jgi:hypothetical protein